MAASLFEKSIVFNNSILSFDIRIPSLTVSFFYINILSLIIVTVLWYISSLSFTTVFFLSTQAPYLTYYSSIPSLSLPRRAYLQYITVLICLNSCSISRPSVIRSALDVSPFHATTSPIVASPPNIPANCYCTSKTSLVASLSLSTASFSDEPFLGR